MLMTNKLTLPVESRMQGDLHVRFGGRLWETYHRKVVRRPSPSLRWIATNPAFYILIEWNTFGISFVHIFFVFIIIGNVRRIIDHLGRFFRLLCALLTIPHISQHFQALV